MTIRVGPVGVRGLALLTAAGVTGLVLGVHGWSARHVGLAVSATGALGTRGAASAPRSTGGHHTSPGPHTTTGLRAAASPASGGAGPLLRSEPFASYAYQVWPGSPGPAAKEAMTGLTISVSRQSGGIAVKAGVNGQSAPATHSYPHGARVYVVEAALGDDSGSSDYNLGDDGLVVTDAQGRIVQ